MKKLYEILGITKESPPSEIKEKYYAIAKRCHPDVNPGKEDEFKAASEAYAVLSDPERKARYDESGDTSDPEYSERKDAFEMIGSLFGEILSKTDPAQLKYVDVIDDIKSKLNRLIANKQKELGSVQSLIPVWQEALTRIHVKDHETGKAMPDVMSGLIKQRLEEITTKILSVERQVRVFGKAIGYLEYYEYRNDVRERGSFYFNQSAANDPRIVIGFCSSPDDRID